MKPFLFEEPMADPYFTTLDARVVNSNNANKPVEKFRVSFLKMPENLGNFLGKRVKTITYPQLGADIMVHKHRRTTFPDKGQIIVGGELQIGFIPDSNAIVEMFLFHQLGKQYSVVPDAIGNAPGQSEYKLDIKIDHLSIDDKVVKTDIFKNCFMNMLMMPEMDTAMDSQMVPLITAGFSFDGIDMSALDDMMTLRFGVDN